MWCNNQRLCTFQIRKQQKLFLFLQTCEFACKILSLHTPVILVVEIFVLNQWQDELCTKFCIAMCQESMVCPKHAPFASQRQYQQLQENSCTFAFIVGVHLSCQRWTHRGNRHFIKNRNTLNQRLWSLILLIRHKFLTCGSSSFCSEALAALFSHQNLFSKQANYLTNQANLAIETAWMIVTTIQRSHQVWKFWIKTRSF